MGVGLSHAKNVIKINKREREGESRDRDSTKERQHDTARLQSLPLFFLRV